MRAQSKFIHVIGIEEYCLTDVCSISVQTKCVSVYTLLCILTSNKDILYVCNAWVHRTIRFELGSGILLYLYGSVVKALFMKIKGNA
jgi:hypothetical protein